MIIVNFFLFTHASMQGDFDYQIGPLLWLGWVGAEIKINFPT